MSLSQTCWRVTLLVSTLGLWRATKMDLDTGSRTKDPLLRREFTRNSESERSIVKTDRSSQAFMFQWSAGQQ